MLKTQFSDADLVRMRRMMLNGASNRELAQFFGRKITYVHAVRVNRIRGGVGPDASRAKPVRNRSVEQRNRIIHALARHGYPVQDIVELSGLSRALVYRIIKPLGLHAPSFSGDPAVRAGVMRMYEQDRLTLNQIASHYQRSYATISYIVRSVRGERKLKAWQRSSTRRD